MTRIAGRRVAIRPLRPGEFDALYRSRVEADPTTFAGSLDPEPLRRRVERSGTWTGRAIDLAIEADGRLIGEIQTYDPPDRDLPEHVFEIGIALHDPADRGKGYGADAFATFVGWLFEEAGAIRVQAPTHPSNAAMRGVLRRLGFSQQGLAHADGKEFLQHVMDRETWQARSGGGTRQEP